MLNPLIYSLIYLSNLVFTLGVKGVCKAGGMNDVGGGTAPLRKGSGGLGIPRAENSGKPGARKNIEFAPPIFGTSFIYNKSIRITSIDVFLEGI